MDSRHVRSIEQQLLKVAIRSKAKPQDKYGLVDQRCGIQGKMLVLFETAAGYAMFKLLSDKKLKNVDNIYEEFSTAEKAQESLQLVAFKKFKSTTEAVESACALHEGKINKTLKKLLKGKVNENEQLAVGDAKLGNLIKVCFVIVAFLYVFFLFYLPEQQSKQAFCSLKITTPHFLA
ncbi:unnamed protein product [Haemonchus placei]|uniref:NOP5NT domain-containing protein n=1 Tax=Haemonchus placei TaxID=6290 RepID=A0A0N4VWQ0_HAEPC|nr:unnamed protein product [Haemonchus placei]